MTKDEVSFPITNMQSNGGFINGNFTYFRSYMGDRMFKTNLKAEKIDIETLLREFGMKEDVHSGELEVELCLTAKKGMKRFTTGLNGYMEIDAKDGKLEKLVAISKIMALFSPLAYDELFQSGFPYDDLNAEIHIENGIFKTEDLYIRSNAMRMTGIGKINSNNATIDMILAAHPFTTIDLLKNIPGFSIILGDGFMSVYYKAKGKVFDPELEALQAKSLGKFTIGMIERIYTVPRDAWKGKKELTCE